MERMVPCTKRKPPVVIRTRNRPAELASCLYSFLWQTVDNFSVWIFEDSDDMAVTDPLVRNAIECLSKIKGVTVHIARYKVENKNYWTNAVWVMQHLVELGYTSAIFFDDDQVAPPDFLAKYGEVLEKEENVGFLYCPIIEPLDHLKRPVKADPAKTYDDDIFNESRRYKRVSKEFTKGKATPWVQAETASGGLAFMRLVPEIIAKMAALKHDSGDDLYYTRQLRKKGWRGLIRLDMHVIHNISPARRFIESYNSIKELM